MSHTPSTTSPPLSPATVVAVRRIRRARRRRVAIASFTNRAYAGIDRFDEMEGHLR